MYNFIPQGKFQCAILWGTVPIYKVLIYNSTSHVVCYMYKGAAYSATWSITNAHFYKYLQVNFYLDHRR